MLTIFMLAAAVLASLAMSACQTTSLQQTLAQTCSAGETAHLAFIAFAEAGAVSERTVEREAAAYAALAPLCDDPANATNTELIVRAASALAIITVALREAESG